MLELCQSVFNFVLWYGRSLPPAQDEFQKDVKSGMMDVVPHQCEGMGGNDRYLIFCFQQLVIILLHNAEYCHQTKCTNFLRNEDYLSTNSTGLKEIVLLLKRSTIRKNNSVYAQLIH